MFEVGLKTKIDQLIHSGHKAATVAVMGFILPFVLGYITSHWLFDLSVLVSLFIGGTLTATSIGVTIRILTDLGQHNSHEGQIVLGAAVIDDLLGDFLLAVLYEFAFSGEVNIGNILSIIFYVSLFFMLAPVVAKLFSPWLKNFSERSKIPALIPVVLVSFVLIFAYFAHLSGAPDLIGGFVAGIALSRRFYLPLDTMIRADPEFTSKVHRQMKPIVQLFTPIFLSCSASRWT